MERVFFCPTMTTSPCSIKKCCNQQATDTVSKFNRLNFFTKQIRSASTHIPACAELNIEPYSKSCAERNYPRTRGANSTSEAWSAYAAELSPHTRSKSRPKRAVRKLGGTIPAYAEQIKAFLTARLQGGNYPRTRGENIAATRAAGELVELSPHTRSKCRQTRTKRLKFDADDSDTASLLLRKLAERQRNVDFKRTLVFFLRLNNFKSTS